MTKLCVCNDTVSKQLEQIIVEIKLKSPTAVAIHTLKGVI